MLSEGLAKLEDKFSKSSDQPMERATEHGENTTSDPIITNPTGINLAEMNTKLDNVTVSSKIAHRRLHLEGEKRDQYSQREILRVTGVPYKQGEDTTELMIRIANRLGVYITTNDISVSHRSGRRVVGNNRPILVKFVNVNTYTIFTLSIMSTLFCVLSN